MSHKRTADGFIGMDPGHEERGTRVLLLGGSHDGEQIELHHVRDYLKLPSDFRPVYQCGVTREKVLTIETYGLYWPGYTFAPLYLLVGDPSANERAARLYCDALQIEHWVANRVFIAYALDKAWADFSNKLAKVCAEHRLLIHERDRVIEVTK
ncbi:MAG TPA: hypothetical protein VG125_33885 [Pirellulales bacterium]|jgi:hypothetical protein|nr:hypothetical protein [Pirellulales bacterium]